MTWKLKPVLFGLVLTILSAPLLAAGELLTAPTPFWRDAPQTDAESELDRVSRAYIRLAAEARPAIVQIRVVSKSDPKAGAKAQEPQGSRGSGFIIHPDGIHPYRATCHR